MAPRGGSRLLAGPIPRTGASHRPGLVSPELRGGCGLVQLRLAAVDLRGRQPLLSGLAQRRVRRRSRRGSSSVFLVSRRHPSPWTQRPLATGCLALGRSGPLSGIPVRGNPARQAELVRTDRWYLAGGCGRGEVGRGCRIPLRAIRCRTGRCRAEGRAGFEPGGVEPGGGRGPGRNPRSDGSGCGLGGIVSCRNTRRHSHGRPRAAPVVTGYSRSSIRFGPRSFWTTRRSIWCRSGLDSEPSNSSRGSSC